MYYPANECIVFFLESGEYSLRMFLETMYIRSGLCVSYQIKIKHGKRKQIETMINKRSIILNSIDFV